MDGQSGERRGREETSRKAQTAVDGQSVKRHEGNQIATKLAENREAWIKTVMVINPHTGIISVCSR